MEDTAGHLLFRNGLLIAEPQDYVSGDSWFTLRDPVGTALIHAFLYRAGGPTKLTLDPDGGLTATGAFTLQLSPLTATHLSDRTFMLFRNGLLLTEAADYTRHGLWIELVTENAILDTDDFVALISTGGAPCSTASGNLKGAIDDVNSMYFLPFPPERAMIFRNGLLLTRDIDYLHDRVPTYAFTLSSRSGVLVFRKGYLQTAFAGDFLDATSPFELPAAAPDDLVTTRIWPDGTPLGGGPTMLSTVDGSIIGADLTYRLVFANDWTFGRPQDLLVFRNGLLLAIGRDYVVDDFWITLDPSLVLGQHDMLVALTSMPSVTYSSLAGTILGDINGVNRHFSMATFDHTSMLFLDGKLLTEGLDYIIFDFNTDATLVPLPRAGDPFGRGRFGETQFGGRTGGITGSLPSGILLLDGNIPQPGAVLIARQPFTHGPVQVTTFDGSLARVDGRFKDHFTIIDPMVPTPGDIITAQIFDSPRYPSPAFSIVYPVDPFDTSGSLFGTSQFGRTQFGGRTGHGVLPSITPPPPPFPAAPDEISTWAGTLRHAVAKQAWVLRNGLLMTQGLDVSVTGNNADLTILQTPAPGDIISIQDFTPDPTDPNGPALNLATQFSTADGSISGEINGLNTEFQILVPTLAGIDHNPNVLITRAMVFRGGLFLSEGVDYSFFDGKLIFANSQIPQAGDVITAQVFFE